MLRQKDFTKALAHELTAKYGTIAEAARKIHTECLNRDNEIPSFYTVKNWLSQAVGRKKIDGREDDSRTSRIEKLLEKANVPLDAIRSIDKVEFSQWGYQQKGEDGTPIEGVLDSTKITLTPAAPEFPIVDRAAPKTIQYIDAPRIMKQTYQVVIISDAQIGFLKDLDTKVLESIHDPIAMRVAEKITAAVQPKQLCWIGDWMDWPFLSRWQQHDEFDAVNESIEEGHTWLCRFIAAAGSQCDTKIMVGSNHARRPEQFLLEHNRRAMRIRRAADTSSWPVFSEPYLLRYDDLGIHFTGHYPGDQHYLLPDLVLTHAPPKALEFQASVIHGHTHHLTRSARVQHTASGRQVYYTFDTGCLCQLDSSSNPRSLLRTKTPSDKARTDWTQGICVVNVVADAVHPWHSVDQIAITNGKAIYQNEVFCAGN